MEVWLFFVISLCVATLLKCIHDSLFPKLNLPPGPTGIQLICNLLSILKSFKNFEFIFRNLHSKYGPIVTLQFGPQPAISMSTNFLAHQALVQNGAIFADRPRALHANKFVRKHTLSFSLYGPNWRLLRRNIISEILHPSRIRSYSHSRKRVLEILISKLGCNLKPVHVLGHLQYAMFSSLALMCFGDKLEENQIEEIKRVQNQVVMSVSRFNVLGFWPSVTKILFRKRWEEFLRIFKEQEDAQVPLIRARQQLRQENRGSLSSSSKDYVLSYVDTLLDLQLPEENRKLEEGEINTLCSEFISAGAGTTAVAFEWIMANVVKHPHVQAKIFEEISGVVEQKEEEVKEEDLHKLPYLKAVILEGLRRHPPTHLLLPHSVTQDIAFEGYVIPKNTMVNFLVADIGWNPQVWEDPMEFKPERFLTGEAFDIAGSREIKMMPFGAGRRMCPGYGLAMLHLEYFVANLVWKFEWRAVDGDDIDLSEKCQDLATVMKNPLQALVSPRFK